MAYRELLEYIKTAQKNGLDEYDIKKALLEAGWQQSDIDEGFLSLNSNFQTPYQGANETNSPYPSPAMEPGSKIPAKKILLIVTFIFGALLIGGGAIYAYSSVFQSPEKIIGKALLNLGTIQSFSYDSDTSLEYLIKEDHIEEMAQDAEAMRLFFPQSQIGRIIENGRFNIGLNSAGSFDWSIPDNFKAAFSISATVPDIIGGSSKDEYGFTFRLRVINKNLYLQTVGLDRLLTGSFLGSVDNQWLRLELNEIKERSDRPALNDPEKLKEQLKLLWQDASIFKVLKKLPDGIIDGQKTHRIAFQFDRENITEFYEKLETLLNEDASNTQNERSPTTDYSAYFEQIEKLQGEIWVGKQDNLPHRLILSVTDMEFEPDSAFIIEKSLTTLNLKNFNQPLQVETPPDSKNFSEFIEGLLSAWMPGPDLQNPENWDGWEDLDWDGNLDFHFESGANLTWP